MIGQLNFLGHHDTKTRRPTPNRLFPVPPVREGVWMCKLIVIYQQRLMIEVKLLLSANKKLYTPS